MKSLILLICLISYVPRQEFLKITLFTGRFIYAIPQGMTSFGPRLGNSDYKYVKYYLNKDSSFRIEVNLQYQQLNSLQVYQKPQQEALLHRIDGVNKRIMSNEMQVMQGRKIMLIFCEYALPGEKRDKGIASRIVFNTSAGLTSINMLYSFKTPDEKEQGQLLFKKIIDNMEIH